MRRTERLLAYPALAVVVAALVGQAAGLGLVSPAAATPLAPPAVDPAKLATCDIYQLVERLVEGDQYMPARNAEQERVKAQLAPMEAELEAMQKDLQTADPKDPAAQDRFKAFQTRRDEYMAKRQAAADGYSDLVTGQFADAYLKVCAGAKKVADSLGYGYVIAHKKGEIKAHDPRQLVEEFLSRPMAVSPEGTDITEQVRAAMKLPEKAASPAAPGTPGATGLEKPAPPGATPTPAPGSPAAPVKK